jgi:hypothetical protein
MDFCSLINELEKHHASYLSMKECEVARYLN